MYKHIVAIFCDLEILGISYTMPPSAQGGDSLLGIKFWYAQPLICFFIGGYSLLGTRGGI